MQCPTCQGVGTLATGRYEGCYRCGGSGQGAATDVPCMACGGAGTSTTEVRDSCFDCGGGGVVADPAPVQGRGPKKSAPPAPQGQPAAATPSGSRFQKHILVIALLFGAVSGLIGYGQSSELSDGITDGLITFVITACVLHLLLFVVKVLLQVAKVAIPLALVLVLGHFLDWKWAQATTQWLKENGTTVVEAAEKQWGESEEESAP